MSSFPVTLASSGSTSGAIGASGYNLATTLAPPERQGTIAGLVSVVMALGSVVFTFAGAEVLKATQVPGATSTVSPLAAALSASWMDRYSPGTRSVAGAGARGGTVGDPIGTGPYRIAARRPGSPARHGGGGPLHLAEPLLGARGGRPRPGPGRMGPPHRVPARAGAPRRFERRSRCSMALGCPIIRRSSSQHQESP